MVVTAPNGIRNDTTRSSLLAMNCSLTNAESPALGAETRELQTFGDPREHYEGRRIP